MMADPFNDQTAARAREDLADHVESARRTLAQGDRSDALAVIAVTLIEARHTMPRDRLASLLAMALVQLAEMENAVDAAMTD
jgi:hypothetical protein